MSYYLIRDDDKVVFELGTGSWRFALRDKDTLSNKLVLLQMICIISVMDDLNPITAYALWLSDAIYDFCQQSNVRLDETYPEGYEVIQSRYQHGSGIFIEYVRDMYGKA